MKRFILIPALLLVLVSFTTAMAGTFSDVPANHWAYDAIEKLQSKGILLGYIDGTFKGDKTLSRYTMAMLTAKMLANVEQALKIDHSQVTKDDIHLLESLAFEFADELSLLGTNVNSLFDELNSVNEEVAQLKEDAAQLKKQTVDKNQKVRIGGEFRLLHTDAVKTQTPGDNVHTSGEMNFTIDANISEKVSASVCWHLYLQNFGNRDFTGVSSMGGSVTSQNDVDIAYIHIEDFAKGNMRFGRDFYTHGNALVLNDYVDAVSYSRKVGDLDMALNLIYDRQNGTYATTSNDFHHIWNLNIDAKRRKHNLYFGYYAQTQKDDINAAGAVANDTKNAEKEILEFGSKGVLCHKTHLDYDLGFVHSNTKIDRFAGTWIGLEDNGMMHHFALKWDDPRERVAVKVAYTAANAEYNGSIALDNDQRAYDGVETPFDDIDRIMGGIKNNFANTKDLKIQAEYFPNDQRHTLRLAYDKVEERKNNGNSDFIPVGQTPDNYNAANFNKLDMGITTIEHSYKYRANTRIRTGFTAADNSSCRDALNGKVQDEQLLWTEIYSKF